jgi:hypothetical protein
MHQIPSVASSTLSHLTALDTLPYVAQLVTAAIAIVAVISARQSSRASLQGELRQRMWEKRTDAYLDLLRELLFFDPRDVGPKQIADQAEDGKEVLILEHFESREWISFVARIEAVSSDEVRYLFDIWQRALSGWTWILSKALVHLDLESEFHEEAQSELRDAQDAIEMARVILTEQVRAELRFEKPELPEIEAVAPEAYFGAITKLRAHARRPPKYPLQQTPRIRSFKREEFGERFGIQL